MAGKSYESLMGAIGRTVFYRPERQRVRELLSRDARPKLLIGGHPYPLFDVSMNGLSFLDRGDAVAWPVGDEFDLSLVLHDEEVYTGRARVARIEPGPRRSVRIGLGLLTGFLDLPNFRRRDDEKKLKHQLENGAKTGFEMVPAGYREVVAEVLHFFQYYRQTLNYHEQRYLSEGKEEHELLSLAVRAAAALRDQYMELQFKASQAAYQCLEDRDILLISKHFTETMLIPSTLDVPFNHRAYTKPLGYPGDYQSMASCYTNGYEGESTFAKVFHKFAVEHPLSNGVRTRKDYLVGVMKSEHEKLIESNQEAPVFRVVSLACGPAREVSDYIQASDGWPGKTIWTLIDQEEESLSVAYRDCQEKLAGIGSVGQLNLLNLSFVQLLTDGVPLSQPRSQHLVFCAGLFDYLRESRAKILIRGLFDLLAEGGLLAIGNAVAPQEMFWSAEFLVDWTLLYRTEEEMLRLGALLPESAEVEVIKEPGQAYYFLLARRKKSDP
jgi:hypothetical protein